MLFHCSSPCGSLYTSRITHTSINQLLFYIVYAIEMILLGWNNYLSYVWALRKTPVKLVFVEDWLHHNLQDFHVHTETSLDFFYSKIERKEHFKINFYFR